MQASGDEQEGLAAYRWHLPLSALALPLSRPFLPPPPEAAMTMLARDRKASTAMGIFDDSEAVGVQHLL